MNVARVEYRLDVGKYFLVMESDNLFTSTVVDADHVWSMLDMLHFIEGNRHDGLRPEVKLNRNGVQQLRCYDQKRGGVLICWHGDETSITLSLEHLEVPNLKNSCITALLRAGEATDRVLVYA